MYPHRARSQNMFSEHSDSRVPVQSNHRFAHDPPAGFWKEWSSHWKTPDADDGWDLLALGALSHSREDFFSKRITSGLLFLQSTGLARPTMRRHLEVPIFRQRCRQIDSVIGAGISKTTEKKQWRARSPNCWCECGRKSRREMAFQRDRRSG